MAPPYHVYSVAEFSCIDEYVIAETDQYALACRPDGTWSSEIPTCVPDICVIGKSAV